MLGWLFNIVASWGLWTFISGLWRDSRMKKLGRIERDLESLKEADKDDEIVIRILHPDHVPDFHRVRIRPDSK